MLNFRSGLINNDKPAQYGPQRGDDQYGGGDFGVAGRMLCFLWLGMIKVHDHFFRYFIFLPLFDPVRYDACLAVSFDF